MGLLDRLSVLTVFFKLQILSVPNKRQSSPQQHLTYMNNNLNSIQIKQTLQNCNSSIFMAGCYSIVWKNNSGEGVRCGEAQNLGPQTVERARSNCRQGYPACMPHNSSLRDWVAQVKLRYYSSSKMVHAEQALTLSCAVDIIHLQGHGNLVEVGARWQKPSSYFLAYVIELANFRA